MKKIAIVIIITTIIIIIIMTQLKKIKITKENIKYMHFSYSTGTMIDSNVSYELKEQNGKYIATIKPNNKSQEEKKEKEINEETLNKIVEILNKYNISTWNNFHKSNKNILDGNSFSFRLTTKDNKEIQASGYMKYPKNYGKVSKELDTIFEKIYKEEKIEELEYLNLSYSTGTSVDSNVYYKIEKKENKYILTIKPNNIPDEKEKKIELTKKQIEEIENILNENKVSTWDGFYENDTNVLDGDSFSFSLKSKNTKIQASGYMKWPETYGKVEKELDTIFNKLYEDN